MVFRCYIERKEGFQQESAALCRHFETNLGLHLPSGIRILHRYDVEGLSEEEFRRVIPLVFRDPAKDGWSSSIDDFHIPQGATVIPVESLPGQFDQRADSAAQCIQFVLGKDRPFVRYATLYIISDELREEDRRKIMSEMINPVENRLAALNEIRCIREEMTEPEQVEVLTGFRYSETASWWIDRYSLAMDEDDFECCRSYFIGEDRDPTITELRVIDTYWSDHCRHTTFHTELTNIEFHDGQAEASFREYQEGRQTLKRHKPISLMDMATLAAKELKAMGLLTDLDESEEINACTVRIKVELEESGESEDWLLLFKNETHNHPTEIEPFGGAATCLGGAIRDPLSGRGYVYQAMRVTGAAGPLVRPEQTPKGKLLQRQIMERSAEGYSSYGNQIGVPTGMVEEIYHGGYVAKRMECGAVIAAVPSDHVVREVPASGDIVLLLGGRTGRDGLGGATGSSKSHSVESVEVSAAEVQKGNAPDERSLMRLFRKKSISTKIKRCNDFGAGGVSVAIGELADGLSINLDAIPLKYAGLDGTEIAISESQERMAVVIDPTHLDFFMEESEKENVECTHVATITEEPRMTMQWKGMTIVDLSRAFLDTNGAQKRMGVVVTPPKEIEFPYRWTGALKSSFLPLISDLNVASQEGLIQRFDQTVGARTVLFPLGGRTQKTSPQAMVARIPRRGGGTDTSSVMAFGYNPILTEADEYTGAYVAVLESVAKVIASGGRLEKCWLTFQEYFRALGRDKVLWGSPVAALLGAYQAQKDLRLAAIGGKDSMSGTFEELHVPPTLLSFAVSVSDGKSAVSPEWKCAGSTLVLVSASPARDNRRYEDGAEQKHSKDEAFLAAVQRHLPNREKVLSVLIFVQDKIQMGQVASAATATFGGLAESLGKMSFGNRLGLNFDESFEFEKLFGWHYGSFLLELDRSLDDTQWEKWRDEAESLGIDVCRVGTILEEPVIRLGSDLVTVDELIAAWEKPLSSFYRTTPPAGDIITPMKKEWIDLPKRDGNQARLLKDYSPLVLKNKTARPRVLIPVFPGTNCEEESALAFEKAGGDAKILIIRNRTKEDLRESHDAMVSWLRETQILFIPGGFSGGDEPDGSGKFINAFLRGEKISEEIMRLLEERDGLIGGICNGFQALVKLGLLPYGKITEPEVVTAILTSNLIGRHQAKMVTTRINTTCSPWLMYQAIGEEQSVAISHGEGRFVYDEDAVDALFTNGQVATQYVDDSGTPSMETMYNPNGSTAAIEGLISPDGRVFGRMGHSERMVEGTLKNIGRDIGRHLSFQSACDYFRQ